MLVAALVVATLALAGWTVAMHFWRKTQRMLRQAIDERDEARDERDRAIDFAADLSEHIPEGELLELAKAPWLTRGHLRVAE